MILAAVLLGWFQSAPPPSELPAGAVRALKDAIRVSQPHDKSVWRDRRPLADDGRLVAWVEIARGDRRKFEFDIAGNRMRLDRTLPASLGGYPVNYGIVPQTVSYDGDPFDVLVLGPALRSGTLVRGIIVGVMHMEDEKGLDSKVVISPAGEDGRPQYQLTDAERERMTRFFDAYKRHELGKFSRVTGWGDASEGLAFVKMTHAFFEQCRAATTTCVIAAR